MLKRKEQEKRVESQGRAILKDLRDAYLDGYMNRKSFDKWYDRYLGALAEKDRTYPPNVLTLCLCRCAAMTPG